MFTVVELDFDTVTDKNNLKAQNYMLLYEN